MNNSAFRFLSGIKRDPHPKTRAFESIGSFYSCSVGYSDRPVIFRLMIFPTLLRA